MPKAPSRYPFERGESWFAGLWLRSQFCISRFWKWSSDLRCFVVRKVELLAEEAVLFSPVYQRGVKLPLWRYEAHCSFLSLLHFCLLTVLPIKAFVWNEPSKMLWGNLDGWWMFGFTTAGLTVRPLRVGNRIWRDFCTQTRLWARLNPGDTPVGA